MPDKGSESRIEAWRKDAREGLAAAARAFRRDFEALERRLAQAKKETAARAEDFRERLLAPAAPSEEEFRARLVILEMEYEGRARAAEQGLALLSDALERCLERLGRWAEDLCARLGGSAPAAPPAVPSIAEGPAPGRESEGLQALLRGVLDALARRSTPAAEGPTQAELAREVKAIGQELNRLKSSEAPAARSRPPRDMVLRRVAKRIQGLAKRLEEKDRELARLRAQAERVRQEPVEPAAPRPPKSEAPAIPLPPPPPAEDLRLERALAALDAEKQTLELLLKSMDARMARAVSPAPAPAGEAPTAGWAAEREELLDQVGALQRELSTLKTEHDQSKRTWENILSKHDEVRLREIFRLKEEIKALRGGKGGRGEL